MKNRQNIRFFENYVSQRLTASQLLRVKGGDNEPPPPPNTEGSLPDTHLPRPK